MDKIGGYIAAGSRASCKDLTSPAFSFASANMPKFLYKSSTVLTISASAIFELVLGGKTVFQKVPLCKSDQKFFFSKEIIDLFRFNFTKLAPHV